MGVTMVADAPILTEQELVELERCEAEYEAGMDKADRALREIHERGLYLLRCSRFDDYCQTYLGMSDDSVRLTLRFYGLLEDLKKNPTIVGILPDRESHTRPLFGLTRSEERAEAWNRAVLTAPKGRVTARHVQAIVDEMRGTTERPPSVHFSSDSAEWYTPDIILERVMPALGDIDLDPCADPDHQVAAKAHYTIEDNGLALPWHGRIYMNPPYGRDINAWIAKLVDEFTSGNVTAAIALVPARLDTDWWETIGGFPFCAVHGRLKFSGHDNSAPFPSAAFYLGGDLPRFYSAFKDIGRIYSEITD